ncbi:hypothetical protein ACWZHB_33025 [Nocardia sp. FBN12]|uniref:hypothetical protein n=1 Tax=Nocardia sp. FBN12 TaxID=3419766 RepID=UPI003CFE91CC
MTDSAVGRSHITLKTTFDQLVADPAIEAKADYAKIASGWQQDIEIFAARINRSSTSAWSGNAANTARQAISEYAVDAQNLTPTLNAMSTRVSNAVDAVLKTKELMPEYGDAQSAWNPGDWFDGDPDKREEEKAQKIVDEHYVNPISAAAGGIPVLPQPRDPVKADDLSSGGDNGGGGNGGNGGANSATPTTATPTTEKPTTEDPATEDPQSSNPGDETAEDPQSTTPQSTSPGETTPQSTVPQTAVPSTGQPGSGTPTGGTPGGSGGGGGGAAAGLAAGGAASPGKAVPGTPGGVRAGTVAAASAGNAAAGRNGMPGMGGMGAGGARGGQGSEDDEHATPDYLVYDRESELLGVQPPALPPGGVIGA